MRYHWWNHLNTSKSSLGKLRCSVCEEIVVFSGYDAAQQWIEYDESTSCPGIPGPVRPQDSEYPKEKSRA